MALHVPGRAAMRMEWMLASALLLVLTPSVTSLCNLRADSHCKFDTGVGLIDLSPLGKNSGHASFSNIPGMAASRDVNVSFSYNPCFPFTSLVPVGTIINDCRNVMMCERYSEKITVNETDRTVTVIEIFYLNLGDTENMSCGDDEEGRYVQYEAIGTSTELRISRVHLVCNEAVEGQLIPMTKNITNSTYDIAFQLLSKYSCVIPPSPPTGSGISTGSILLIIAFVCSALYLLLGTAGRFCLVGARGVEVLPHLDFWRDLPDLVLDGCRFCKDLACEKEHQAKYDEI